MRLDTLIRSGVMRVVASKRRRGFVRARARLRRRLTGAPATVHYFHQVDDPYSHLAAQALDALRGRYDVAFRIHLVPPPGDAYLGDADRYADWALRDVVDIAPYYGLGFPADARLPCAEQAHLANRCLAGALDSVEFAARAGEIGDRLWTGAALQDLASAGQVAAQEALADGERLRRRWKHFRGAMFNFEGEWYWGVDRLCRLEERLVGEGHSRRPGAALCVPRPVEPDIAGLGASGVRLEYFPSLRSPYTAISFRRTMRLAEASGAELALKPVLPMMMRGVPAPAEKGLYILSDTAREAEALGERFGRVVDPFGEPVKRGFSLYLWASEQGAAAAYIQSYLDAAFAEGIDITSDKGLRRVVERAGLDWRSAATKLGRDGWQRELDRNLEDLQEAGLWGVPSFRISGGNRPGSFSCWGQDRLWRVAAEISDRA